MNTELETIIKQALKLARETRHLEIGAGANRSVGRVFERLFGSARAIVVADENTFAAAGRDVADALRRAGQAQADPFIFAAAGLHAEWNYVEQLEAALAAVDGIAVAVGSGTINDLTKLVSSRLGRPYMVAATAASMDGYTAFGASITKNGSKQTFDCAAPAAVVADVDVIARAPERMNASGYADLMAKFTAGADWLLAEGAGVEAVDAEAWEVVQAHLRSWLAEPRRIRESHPESLHRLLLGLIAGGFAMQHTRSSRAASGAEHQFSHLWDMQHHTHNGQAPSHGFKVGIGTLASARLYEYLLGHDFAALNIGDLVARLKDAGTAAENAAALFQEAELASKAREEVAAKHPSREALEQQLLRLGRAWPSLSVRLSRQIPPADELAHWLAEAGAPCESAQIGIPTARLRRSHWEAQTIRRRYTVLDVALHCNLLELALENLYPGEGQTS